MTARLRLLWCRLMHSGCMLPIHSRYKCPTCLIEREVEW